jgi:3-oxoacyl-[acyl-carrier-protein] synthase II
MSSTTVVVTGLGATTPVGGDVPSTWEALLSGKSGIAALTEDWAEQLPVRIAGRVAVEPTEILERVQARRLDRGSQMALIAGREAWADAGGDAIGVDKERLGVVVASGIGGITTLLNTYDVLNTKGPRLVSPLAIPMLIPNAPAVTVALDIGAKAGVHTPVSACASGAEALAMGLELIRSGRADVVVAGGTEAAIHPLPSPPSPR